MVRKLRVFTREQTAAMVALFDEGLAIALIGERYGSSFYVARRVLKAELGDLRTARAMSKARGAFTRHRPAEAIASQLGQKATSGEYREGFEAGYRMALTHVNLYGLEQARVHCNTNLLPWRDEGLYEPPALGEQVLDMSLRYRGIYGMIG